jgi:hypothetical protein
MYCKHHLPFEVRCQDCTDEAMRREAARHAAAPAVEQRTRARAEPPRANWFLPALGKAN